MLTIGKLGASPDQLGYYEQQVAQGIEDYFSGRGEAPGRWVGRGCGGMGLSGQVDRIGFMRAMSGRDPRTGAQLRPEHGRTKIAAFDLTFSAPKSVSVLFAVADEETSAALLEAHERAVEAALRYVEQEACFTRRGRNGVQRVRGDGFVAAAYRHRLSRAGDPQLHTHVVVANVTRAEGRWTTLEAHGLYEHVSAGGAIYRAVLRAEVRKRLPWVWWRAAGRGLFEIEAVPEGVLREFSRRRVEIEEGARELTGVAASSLSRERLQGIALATRKAKEYGVDGARWQQEARARAAEHGFGRRELERLVSSPSRSSGPSAAAVGRSTFERLSGPEGLTAQHNTFARRHVLAEIAGEFVQGASLWQLERAMSDYLEYGSVVPLGRIDGEHRFTTRGLLACEREIVEGAARRADERIGLVDPGLPDPGLAGVAEPLSDEQARAARALATDGQGVSVLQALAGTGKTRVLAALARIYDAGGYRVIGVAPTGRAARELGDTAGIVTFTIHRLLAEVEELGGFAPRTVVLFDEAGMAPTRPSAALFAHAQLASAKVIVVGDSGQLPSVAAGGWFSAIAATPGGPELRQVMRQRDRGERAALEALHDGDPHAYLDFKLKRGDLQAHPWEGDALTLLLTEWDRARVRYGLSQAVMIAPDNATRAVLNERARERLKLDGSLALRGVVVGGQDFCPGDRVIARRNDRWRDVDNGTRGTVVATDQLSGAVTVRTDAGGHRLLDASYVADHLEHAYGLTGHGTQGATVEWAGVIGRPSAFTAEWAYTALSRARQQTRLHLIAEPSPARREREQSALPELAITGDAALNATCLAMKRHERERLAIEEAKPQELPAFDDASGSRLPLAELAEAGAERTALMPTTDARPERIRGSLSPEPDWRALRRQRDAIERGRTIGR